MNKVSGSNRRMLNTLLMNISSRLSPGNLILGLGNVYLKINIHFVKEYDEK